MFLSSSLSISRHLLKRTTGRQRPDIAIARKISMTPEVDSQQSDMQPSQEQKSKALGDDQLYIEDNLKLDIKYTPETTVINVIPVSSGREGKLVKVDHDHHQACVLCRLNLKGLHYTDILILSQFVKRNGSLVTYHESKLCTKQYLKVAGLIKQAQRCNLMPRPADYLVPGAWHDLNTYLEPDRKRDQPMKYVKKEYWKI